MFFKPRNYLKTIYFHVKYFKSPERKKKKINKKVDMVLIKVLSS